MCFLVRKLVLTLSFGSVFHIHQHSTEQAQNNWVVFAFGTKFKTLCRTADFPPRNHLCIPVGNQFFVNGRVFGGLSVDECIHLHASTVQASVVLCEREVPEKTTPMEKLKLLQID